jgi:lysophospholipase L1-like esterase
MKKDWWSKEFSILMTLGESTTAGGWSSSRDRSWPYVLARLINDYQRVPVQLVNLGIGANVISTRSPGYPFSGKPAADERLAEHVLSHRANGYHMLPDLLVISYGLNDARSGTPIPLFCEEMTKIIDQVRTKCSPLIVLLGPYYMTDFQVGGTEWSYGSLEVFQAYSQAINNLAVQHGCLFADLLAAYDRGDWLVHHDGVHANDLGHRIVANKIFEVLAQNCSGLAAETRFLESKILPWRDESTLQTQWERDHDQK